MPEDYKAIFHRALAISDDADRAKFLDEAFAADASLRYQVESLLQAHAEAEHFMQADLDETQPVVGPHVGDLVGGYKLREKIGEGGMGVVYIAEQEKPVRRKVALKIIKPGMDTQEVIARFQAERQALALMDHPNIAKVFDGGSTEQGRPYFVMELVRGVPITEYCDQACLSTPERLNLFMTVSQAIQHAHRRGIIHRDIKPSNVLVSLHDGQPVVKVIDFGVAKAVNQQLTEMSVYTRFQQVIGTPLYMSPEQAELSGLDIDTRTDVYSLGVLLYELLTGVTPFDRQHFARAAYDEMFRIIREEEPKKPSTRVSTLSHEEQSRVAKQRASSPTKLSQQLRGELDWILTKTLEKDRSRRYDSASELAEDIGRYLRREPVRAGAPSVIYKFRKFVARQKALAATSAIILLSLLLGITGTTWQAIRARRGEALALRHLYTSDLEEAKREFDASNTRRAFNLIDKYREDPPHEFRGFEWRWLWNQFHRNEEFRLVGHTGEVRCVRFSPDGKLLATGATDGTLRLWDANLQKELWRHKGGKHCNLIDFSPDGKWLIADYWAPGDQDPGTVVWNISDHHNVVQDAPLPPGTIRFSGDGQRLLRAGRPAAVIDRNGSVLQEFDINSHRIRHLSADWRTIVTHDEIWDLPSGERLAKLPEHRGIVQNDWAAAAVWPMNTDIVVTGSLEGARIWNRRGDHLATLPATRGIPITAIDFSKDGNLLAVYKVSGGLQIFDTSAQTPASWKLRQFFPVFSGSTLAFCPTDNDLFAIGGEDGVVRGFRAVENESTDSTFDHDNPVIAIRMSRDGRYLAVAMELGELQLWDTVSKEELSSVEPSEAWVPISRIFCSRDLINFSTDDGLIAIAGPQDKITIRDLQKKTQVECHRVRTGEAAKVSFRYACTQFSLDGRRLYAAGLKGGTGFVEVWDLASSPPRLRAELTRELPGKPSSMDISPDGEQLAVGTSEGMNIYRLPQIKPVRELAHAESGALAIRFSPDGRQLATGSFLPEAAQVWDTSSWQLSAEFHHPMPVVHVSWSEDGKRLATSSFDATTRLWDLETEQVIATFRGAASEFSRDGTILAVGGLGSDYVLDGGDVGRVLLHRAPPLDVLK